MQFYMHVSSRTMSREPWLLTGAALALAVLMTWPLAARLGSASRITSADWQYSAWNVAWVARTVVADPLHLYDANIFFPHRTTLAYSEANIVPGLLAAPAYWLTRNPYSTLNTIVLFSFASSWIAAYLLGRYLSGSRSAAAVAAVPFAFCPYAFSHTAHIQLLMTAGIPAAMLLFHRLVDAPSVGRGVWLGVALALQALSCAYYAIFAGLMVGYATLFVAARRRLWRAGDFWSAIAMAAVTALLAVLPFFIPFLDVQRESGFARSIEDASRWSAVPANYLASPAHAHRWLLALIARYPYKTEILFPGFFAVGFGLLGFVAALRRPRDDPRKPDLREFALLYGSLAVLALWTSFGPAAGLYRVLYQLPAFSFLRAPSRLGLVVTLVFAALTSVGVASLLRAIPQRWSRAAAVLLGVVSLAELAVAPFPWDRAAEVPAPYAVLAKLPRGPVAEFPFYGERVAYHLHAQYMLFSTYHWQPLINGYSDVIPADFRPAAFVLDSFPSTDAFAVLARHRARYIAIHWDMFGPRQQEIRTRLQPFARHLRLLASDDRMTLYEVVSFP